MLGPLPAVLMHLVSVLFLMKKSLELGVTLQEFLQKSLGFSLLGLAHIAAASKSINFALGVEKTCAGSNQLLLTVCLVSLPSAPKYKDFCIISKLLCKTLFWSRLHSGGLWFSQQTCSEFSLCYKTPNQASFMWFWVSLQTFHTALIVTCFSQWCLLNLQPVFWALFHYDLMPDYYYLISRWYNRGSCLKEGSLC